MLGRMSSRRAPDRRVRWGLAAAAGAAACAVLAVAATTAQAAPSPAAAVPAVGLAAAAIPTTTTSGTRTLIVDPAENLAPEGATINVQGSGFATDHGLYVAVCAEGSGAPENLAACVGGAIPDANTTQSWAHITESGQGGSGGVQAAWGENGSFSVSLTLASVTTEALNCVAQRCALYTTSDDDSDRTQDTAVPLTFSNAPASSSTPSTPGTAIPQVVQSAEIQPGGTQLVVFSGFQPNETVGLTLFSREVTLTPVNADTTGVARAQFVVPSDFVVGTHRLEAVGQSSGTVGVASFEVVAPPTPTPSSTPTPTPSPTPTPTPTPSETPTPTPTPTPTTATSSVAADDTSSSSSLWWLWLLLAIIVIAGIITWIVIYQRNKKIAAEREQYERDRAAAAAAEQQRLQGAPPPGADAPTMYLPPAATAGGPPPGADPYGLLSGRDEPYPPAGPTDLIVGAGPTQVIGDPPGYAGPQDYQPPPPGPHAGEGPATEEIPPIRESSAAPGSSAEPPGSSAAPGSSAGSSAAPPPDRSSDTLRGSPQEQTGAFTPPFDDDEPPEGRPRDRG